MNRKVEVFISSKCGEEKYDLMREGLRVLIESTGLASVYVFENEGASTLSAKKHYLSELKRCDLCVFVIDNEDGVPPGVQAEIDLANRELKKSLYYFCNGNDKKETLVQQGLKGANHAKSKVVADFKELFLQCKNDIVENIIQIYKAYAQGSIGSIEETDSQQIVTLTVETDGAGIRKDMVGQSHKTKSRFLELFLGYKVKDKGESSDLDEITSNVFSYLFEYNAVCVAPWEELLKYVSENQKPTLQDVLKCRINAMAKYFKGDLSGCIGELKLALEKAESTGTPQWIKDDILIDLRNMDIIQDEDAFYPKSGYQDKIEKIEHFLYNPVNDRIHVDLYKKIEQDRRQDLIRSPHTVIFGSHLEDYASMCAQSIMAAIYNGSITHVTLIYSQIKSLAFYFMGKYETQNMGLLLIKATIATVNRKELVQMLEYFPEIKGRMNPEESEAVFNFANNLPVSHRRVCGKLMAFKVVAYYLDDMVFMRVWSELRTDIFDWFQSGNPQYVTGKFIVEAIADGFHRIPEEDLVSIIEACLKSGRRFVEEDILSVIASNLSGSELANNKWESILSAIESIICDKERNSRSNALKGLLIKLASSKNSNLTSLEKAVKNNMPNFYEKTYLLEKLGRNDPSVERYIEEWLGEIKENNNVEGINKGYRMAHGNPQEVVWNILDNFSVEVSEKLLDDIFASCTDTLLSDTQLLGSKIAASQLLVKVVSVDRSVLERKNDLVARLKENKEVISNGMEILTNLQQVSLEISILLLYYQMGVNVVADIMIAMSCISGDLAVELSAAESLVKYLKNEKSVIRDDLANIMLHHTMVWCKARSMCLRHVAIEIFDKLMNKGVHIKLVSLELVKMAQCGDPYIKNRILRIFDEAKSIYKDEYETVLARGLADGNYVVRKVAVEIRSKVQ